MTDAIADIARYIDDERRTLEQDVSELAARATAAIDWRSQVRRHPGLMVAAALGGGLLLAQLGGRTRHADSSWSDRADVTDRQDRSDGGPGPLDPIIGAVFAAAASALATVLVETLSVPSGTAARAVPR